MGHIDVRSAATHAFVGSVEELGRRLEPSAGADYCEACDVPDLAPPEGFFAKIAAARTALNRDDYLDASRKAGEAVEILRDLLSNEVTGEQKVEVLLQRMLIPPLLDLLRRGEAWAEAEKPFLLPAWGFRIAYLATVILMMLDRRLAEWFPDAFAGHRMAALLGAAVERWKTASEDGDFDEAWPFYVVDFIGLLITILKFPAWLESPRLQLWTGYGWDAPDGFGGANARAAAERALSTWWERTADLAVAPENYENDPPDTPDLSFGITLVPLKRDLGGPTIAPHVAGNAGETFKLGGDWSMSLAGGSGAPPGSLARAAAGDTAGALLDLKLAYGGKDPAFSWGDADDPESGRAMVVKIISLEGALFGDPAGADPDRTDARAVVRIEKGSVRFGAPDNAFLKRLLPNGIAGDFKGAFGGSVRDGFFWEGGLGTEIFTAVDWKVAAGPLRLEVPHLRMKLKFDQPAPEEPEDGEAPKGTSLSFEAGLGIRVGLGAITFGIGDLGGKVSLSHVPKTDGNLGPFHFDWEIMDPRSVEFVVDAAAVRGEGFLARDPDLDRWSGAWRLKLGSFQLDGIVISEDDSVLGIAWLRNLNIPFPGGTLDGAGILIGTNRRGDADAFLAGIKTGAIGSVLFPDDPVGEAPQIIANLTRFFPREEDHLVAGLMLQWSFGGKARVIVAELGVILEFGPKKLQHAYILGQGDMRLEHLPESVYRVHVELFGHYDDQAESFFLRIELRDSRISSGELTGGGALLVNGPGDESFVATLGGFNPRYKAPQGLGNLPRITAHLSDRPSFKLYFEAYLAVTSSSFQLGGKLALYAEVKGFIVEGYLLLDALFRFDGEFFLDIAFNVTLRRGSRTLASLDIAGTLAGMSTWSLTGRATLKILFVKVSVPIEWTSKGGAEPNPEPVDALAAVAAALGAPESWLQDRRSGAVALTDAARPGIWLAPDQAVEVRQEVLPLGQRITRLGASPLFGAESFEITGMRFGATPVDRRPTSGRFNLSLYRDVDLEEAVRAPFIEELDAGVAADLDLAALGEDVDGTGTHEEIVIDDRFVPEAAGGPAEPAFGLRRAAPETRPEPPVIVTEDEFYRAPTGLFGISPPRYVVADTALQARYGDRTRAVAYGDARDHVEAARQSNLRRYVVRQHEVAA